MHEINLNSEILCALELQRICHSVKGTFVERRAIAGRPHKIYNIAFLAKCP